MGKICANCGTNNPENYKYCSSCGHELPKTETAEAGQAMHVAMPYIPKKKSNGKLILFILGAVLFYTIIAFAIKSVSHSSFFFNKVMVKMADAINKSCPQMIDNGIRLDNVQVQPGNTFQYSYTLTEVGDAPMDTNQIKALAEPKMIEAVKTNPEMKMLRDHKTTLNYCYHRNNGQYLFTVRVTADQYE
ncbi:MAG: zinc ribbon domain-containing protein [Bacteroidetes bacterium]|nr:zinc ribbon domain-containing protein [Bacteroidota bacterium]